MRMMIWLVVMLSPVALGQIKSGKKPIAPKKKWYTYWNNIKPLPIDPLAIRPDLDVPFPLDRYQWQTKAVDNEQAVPLFQRSGYGSMSLIGTAPVGQSVVIKGFAVYNSTNFYFLEPIQGVNVTAQPVERPTGIGQAFKPPVGYWISGRNLKPELKS